MVGAYRFLDDFSLPEPSRSAAGLFYNGRRMKRAGPLTVFLVGCLLLSLAGCGDDPGEAPPAPMTHAHRHNADMPAPAEDTSEAPVQPEGHHRMLELIAEVAAEAEIVNFFVGQGMAPKIREDIAAQPPDEILPKRWYLRLILGDHELRLGNQTRALELYDEALRLLSESKDPVPREQYFRQMFAMGVAYMRMGERRNCVLRHTSDSCLIPIQKEGIHVDQTGSRKAVRFFTQALSVAKPGSREFLRSQWLLNIVYMTLGEYPDGVPEAYRIPPEVFDSDEPFPAFPEIGGKLGLGVFDLAGGAIAEDFDLDGDLDIMVSTSDTSGQMRLFVNNGDGSFTHRVRGAGLEGLLGGLNMIDADYDNDGDVDVVVLRGGWWRQLGRHPNSLLRNNGDLTFTDVTFEAGLGERHHPTQTASWADYDLDGDLDLFVGNESGKAIRFDDGEDTDMTSPSNLFRNNGDGTFTDVAAQAGVENLRYGKSVIWGDYDNDRYPDLFVSNGGHLNRLYHNNGDGTFTDVAPELGVTHPVASFPSWFWDVNNDGNLDLFVSSYGGPKLQPDVASIVAGFIGVEDVGGEQPHLYLGDGKGGFVDVASEWNLERQTLPMGANFGDLDNDGYLDFYLGTGYPYYRALMPNAMFHNLRGKGFADVTTAGNFGHLQKGHGVVFADLDNDGDQDVFEQMGGAYLGDTYANALWLNPGFGNHWIRINLVGVQTNSHGLGARVRVDVVENGEPRSIYVQVTSGGTFGCRPFRREIGVGAAERIEAIEIYWPVSDLTQRFENVAVDQWIEITEGEPEYRPLPNPSFTLGG